MHFVLYNYRPNWIGIYGECYYRDDFVLIGFQDEDLPSFGKIKDIAVASGSIPLVIVDIYRTQGINTHIAAYHILCTNTKSAVLLSDLITKHTFYVHLYIDDGNTYIVMRSHVPNC